MTPRQTRHAMYATVLNAAKTPEDTREVMRRLVLGDVFFLLVYVCGRKDVDRDWLYDRCMEVQAAPDSHLDLWARAHYKALDIDTPVWTTRGWKRHGDLRFGDKVYAPDGSIVGVIANTGPMDGADCYQVGDVVAAGDHLWPVQIKHRTRVVGGRDVWYETVATSTRDAGTMRLPHITPLDGIESSEMMVPPYVLGVWLGDGHAADGRVTSGDDEIWNLLGWENTQTRAPITRNLKGLMPILRALGVLNNKHIPHAYLVASPKDRLALLQGLMDTDGHINTRGTATFTNTNETLVDGVHFLARSFGMRATKRRYEVKGQRGYWQVSFEAFQDEYCPVRLSRKKARCRVNRSNYAMKSFTPVQTSTRLVNCIQVQGGLYLAGKNLTPTHNSTIITYAMTIQDILRDPELTVGIFSCTRPIAKAFLRQIKREFEGNSKLKELFPDVLYANPAKDSPKWSEDDGIVVKRRSNPKEASIEAWGLVDGQPTSKHYSLMVYDDVVTRESVTTPDMIAKVTEAWELSLNLSSEDGRRRYVGTRYHYNDTYQTIIERNVAISRIYPAEANGKPVFLTAEKLADKRNAMGSYIYSCQMLMSPKQDSVMGFNDADLRYWQAQHYQGLNLYLICDPANEKKKGSDYTVMMIVGLGADKYFYLVNMIRDRLSLSERSDRLFAWHRRYRPIEVYYEKYGMQADIAAFEDRMNRDNYRFDIVPVGGNTAKTDRIMGLLPLFENHRVWIPDSCPATNYEGRTEDLTRVFVNDEFKAFPFAAHDDMLDCLARVTDPLVTLRIAFPDFVPDNLYGNNNPAILAEMAKQKQAGNDDPLHFAFST